MLFVTLRPEGNDALLAVTAVVGVGAAVGLAALFLRWPWLLPMAALACAPARVPVKVGGEEASLLLPLYGGRHRRRARARVGALPRQRPRSRARPARVAARRVHRLGGRLAPLERRRASGSRVARGVLSAVRAGRAHARALAVAATLVEGARASADRDGGRVRRDRDLPVADPRRLLEPEGDHRERLRAVLPRELALLGPLDLRAFPRRRDPRRARGRALRRPARLDLRRVHGRRPLDRSRLLVLPVELRRARRRRARGDRALVGATRGRRARAGGLRSARRRLRRAVRARGDPRQHRPCDGKPVDARDGGPAHRRGPPARGRRARRVQERVRRAGRLPRGGPCAGGVAQHAGHRRGGARRAGLAPVRVARRDRALARRSAVPRGASRAARRSASGSRCWRSSSTRSSTTRSSRTR